jgi:putative exosortase-associated protein (TIGR04073 family)
MRKLLPFIVMVAAVAGLTSGCANMEQKFGRGMRNTFEIVRGGDMRRTMEQTAMFEGPEVSYTTGFIKGLNKTLARTGIGVYEMVTFPIPPYGPVATDYLTPNPVFPDSYRPGVLADSMFATDTNLGYSGGDVAPIVPGSKFRVFDVH